MEQVLFLLNTQQSCQRTEGSHSQTIHYHFVVVLCVKIVILFCLWCTQVHYQHIFILFYWCNMHVTATPPVLIGDRENVVRFN